MATTTILDSRRADLRTNILEHPYWITSAEIGKGSDNLSTILFSFPAAVYTRGAILIHEICHEVTTLWAGGTITLDVGSCSLDTDTVTTGGVSTDGDADDYIPTADVTYGTAALYWPDGGDWFDARQANTWGGPAIITPADATVPCINIVVTSNSDITAGASRIHVMISELPLMG